MRKVPDTDFSFAYTIPEQRVRLCVTVTEVNKATNE